MHDCASVLDSVVIAKKTNCHDPVLVYLYVM